MKNKNVVRILCGLVIVLLGLLVFVEGFSFISDCSSIKAESAYTSYICENTYYTITVDGKAYLGKDYELDNNLITVYDECICGESEFKKNTTNKEFVYIANSDEVTITCDKPDVTFEEWQAENNE